MNNFAKSLILASNSPRRKELLSLAGYKFDVIKSCYKEEKFEKFSYDNIKSNSLGKALYVANVLNLDATVIGADTMVILDSVCVLNKPRDISEAIFMLKTLSGKKHEVVTSISLVDSLSKKHITDFSKTTVYFRKINEKEIIEYIKRKNPLDKAGSYGIQDFITYDESKNPPPESFIEKIEGDYYNVVGLDIKLLDKMLKSF